MIPVPITRSRLIQPKGFGEVRKIKSKICGRRCTGVDIAVRLSASRTELDIQPMYRDQRGAEEGSVREERGAEAGAEGNRTGGSSYLVLGWRLGISTVHICASWL